MCGFNYDVNIRYPGEIKKCLGKIEVPDQHPNSGGGAPTTGYNRDLDV